ncbi:MAG TPA: hypothetical protein VJ739_05100 [Gemmataceae bacterium]|nr:hypothetical protein [Gemmataceae bacterium]
MATPWFDPNTFGAWFGTVGGCACGLLGGAVGATAGTLAPRGKARALVFGLLGLSVALGVACFVFGLVALANGQPADIWAWPMYLGGLDVVLFGALGIPLVRRRYAEAENRRLEAEGLRHG